MIIISGSIALHASGPYAKGFKCGRHKHFYDHTTFCLAGALLLEWDGGSIVLKSARPDADAPYHYLIPAHVHHDLTMLEDDTFICCVFSHRDESGKIIQHFDGNDDAYNTWAGNLDPRKIL